MVNKNADLRIAVILRLQKYTINTYINKLKENLVKIKNLIGWAVEPGDLFQFFF